MRKGMTIEEAREAEELRNQELMLRRKMPKEAIPQIDEEQASREKELYDNYSIRWEVPFNEKVRELRLVWNHTAPEIAELLGVPDEKVQNEFNRLDRRWHKLGGELTEEERRIARGQAIDSLETMLSVIDKAQAKTIGFDPKLSDQRLKVTERLNKLRSIESLEDEAARSFSSELAEKIAGLAEPQVLALRQRLAELAPAPVP